VRRWPRALPAAGALAAVVFAGGAFAVYGHTAGRPSTPAGAYAASALAPALASSPAAPRSTPENTAADAASDAASAELPPARPANGTAPAGGVDRSVLSAGGRHSCAATNAGGVFCWGANDRGQLGDGTSMLRDRPGAVAGELRFVEVAAGLTHSCAVTRLGDVYCWGADHRGQLGDATTIRRNAPVRVAGVGTYVRVSAGVSHTCGVTTSGVLRCWGANDRGQLGDGTRESRTIPTAVGGDLGAVVDVAAGGQHSCAVDGGGRVHCWGANREGQLGDGGRGDPRDVPRPVTLRRRPWRSPPASRTAAPARPPAPCGAGGAPSPDSQTAGRPRVRRRRRASRSQPGSRSSAS
jgi:hypothetical protein